MKNKETMKTNQLMNVQLGAMGLVNAWHKNKMLRLEDLLIIGNELRVAKGLPKRRLDVYLSKVDTWEYMVKVWNSEIVGVKDVVQNKAILELKTPAPIEAPLNIVVSEGLQYSTLDDLPRWTGTSKINYINLKLILNLKHLPYSNMVSILSHINILQLTHIYNISDYVKLVFNPMLV